MKSNFLKTALFLFILSYCQMIPFGSGRLEAETTSQFLDSGTEKLKAIHSKLKILHGSLSEEYPEQFMTALYLSEEAKVLELGGNYGRNSCVIAAILKNPRNLVVMEPCGEYARLLRENRDVNGFQFHIEVSALSKVPMIQQGWKTIPSNVVLPGFFPVNTITFDELQKKYQIEFDTMVVDCEGALYYILNEEPDMLKNMNTIIIENDFEDGGHVGFVHDQFRRNGFQVVYTQAGGWGPCYHYFYQVWKK